MTLRNAFGEIATEFTLRRLVDQLRFAKDSADRMRVIVDSAPQVTVWAQNNSAGMASTATAAPYSASAWNAMDARAEMQELSQQTFQITRNRWSIT